MAGSDLKRIESPDDPARCQSPGPLGQCAFKSIPGQSHCQMHQGYSVSKKEKVAARRRYTLGVNQKYYDEEMEAGRIKNLHEEIVLTRTLIQTYINASAKSETDLIRMAPVIQNQIQMLEKLVKTMDHMDRQAGNLLDKAKVQVLGQQMAEIVAKYVRDPELMLQIGTEIGEALDRLDQPQVGNYGTA